MMIVREQIEARIIALKAERQRVLDNVNAYNGAIQQCEWILEQFDAPEEGADGQRPGALRLAGAGPEAGTQ